jgi:serine/threonine-protein kinase
MADANLEQLQDVVRHRYNVEGLVGRGGMGAVYRARHVSLDAPVAIKVLPIPASVGADELARFRREAMLAARLPNPHIVPVYEFEIRGDLAYLVMPLVDGVSLAERIEREGRLTAPEVLQLIQQIGGALAFAHERGIIHRDVKPANILWEPANKRWLITDFGIARYAQPTEDAITSVGAIIGTPAYMAPEQLAGVELDGRTDMFALAATACEALTGKRLRPYATQTTAARALQASGIALPSGLSDVLTAPLAPDPDDRPATMREWIARIGASSRPPWWRSPAGIASAAAAVTILGLAGLLIPARRPTRAPSPVIAVLPFEDDTRGQVGRGLAAAFTDELRWVPGLEVVPAATVGGALAGAGLTAAGTADSATAAALRRYGVSGMLTGSIEDAGATDLRLRAYLRNSDGSTTSAPPRTAPADSLQAAISALVLDLFPFGNRVVGYRPALPGGGVAAMNALVAGDSLFRAAAYDAAVAEYERVLVLDSTYALAAFKRMLAEVMRAQPTRATRAVRTALDPVRRHRANLDPQNRDLLEAYAVLLVEGDLEGAHRRVRDLTDRYPLAVDAWFVRGYLEFYFGPLFGMAATGARFSLDQAIRLDSGFAAARGLRGWIALLEEDVDVARTHLRAYLAIDSTSTWAALARFADSLRLRGDGAAVKAMRNLEDRPTAALELFALAGASMRLKHAERLFVGDAARELRNRATTAEERANAFRLQLGNALGAGRAATVDTLFRESGRWNIPTELDHASVLLAVMALDTGVTIDRHVDEAAARLAADTSEPDNPWLAARWFRTRDAGRAGEARRILQRLAARTDGPSLLARALLGDLEALDRIDAADTTGAFARWAAAVRDVQAEEVPFGLVGSLWPLRVEWARLAAARGDAREVLAATVTLEESPGFMDQAARLVALPLRADALEASGDLFAARDLRRRYADVLRDASGPWAALRDTLRARSGST